MMISRAALLAGLAIAGLAFPAAAQPGPNLTYTHVLTPSAIAVVQERLRSTGDYTGSADGVWSADSQQALERFQQRSGLQTTGQINPATAATLRLNPQDLLGVPGPTSAAIPSMPPLPPVSLSTPSTALPSAPSPVTPAVTTLSAAAIRNIQWRLRGLGLYGGFVDGVWGPATQGAILRLQQARGLQVTGQLNISTAQALGLDPDNLERTGG
ncbi:peptidoglycan-binding domain-containing protein [Muricoccus radiodurans]|uniref:peptidoglycan-binding domain-containing protein n=1 Tax=Muricoccus radiodurans TaxID=2231721 RepID=UPI003CF501C9